MNDRIRLTATPTKSGRSLDVTARDLDEQRTLGTFRLRLEAGHGDPAVEPIITELLACIRSAP